MKSRLSVCLALIATFLAALAAPALAGQATGPEGISVGVNMPPQFNGEYELHMADTAWLIVQGGQADVTSTTPVSVQLWRVSGCHLVTQFTADSNHLYFIAVGPDRSVEVTSPPNMDILPPLGEQTEPQCKLPETATAAKGAGWSVDLTGLALIALVICAAAVSLRTDWRLRGRSQD